MKLRVAKKILKNKEKLSYHKGQVKNAEAVVAKSGRDLEKGKA